MCIYTHIYIYTHTHIYIYIYMCIYIHIYIHTHIYIYIHIYAYIYMCKYINVINNLVTDTIIVLLFKFSFSTHHLECIISTPLSNVYAVKLLCYIIRVLF